MNKGTADNNEVDDDSDFESVDMSELDNDEVPEQPTQPRTRQAQEEDEGEGDGDDGEDDNGGAKTTSTTRTQSPIEGMLDDEREENQKKANKNVVRENSLTLTQNLAKLQASRARRSQTLPRTGSANTAALQKALRARTARKQQQQQEDESSEDEDESEDDEDESDVDMIFSAKADDPTDAAKQTDDDREEVVTSPLPKWAAGRSTSSPHSNAVSAVAAAIAAADSLKKPSLHARPTLSEDEDDEGDSAADDGSDDVVVSQLVKRPNGQSKSTGSTGRKSPIKKRPLPHSTDNANAASITVTASKLNAAQQIERSRKPSVPKRRLQVEKEKGKGKETEEQKGKGKEDQKNTNVTKPKKKQAAKSVSSEQTTQKAGANAEEGRVKTPPTRRKLWKNKTSGTEDDEGVHEAEEKESEPETIVTKKKPSASPLKKKGVQKKSMEGEPASEKTPQQKKEELKKSLALKKAALAAKQKRLKELERTQELITKGGDGKDEGNNKSKEGPTEKEASVAKGTQDSKELKTQTGTTKPKATTKNAKQNGNGESIGTEKAADPTEVKENSSKAATKKKSKKKSLKQQQNDTNETNATPTPNHTAGSSKTQVPAPVDSIKEITLRPGALIDDAPLITTPTRRNSKGRSRRDSSSIPLDQVNIQKDNGKIFFIHPVTGKRIVGAVAIAFANKLSKIKPQETADTPNLADSEKNKSAEIDKSEEADDLPLKISTPADKDEGEKENQSNMVEDSHNSNPDPIPNPTSTKKKLPRKKDATMSGKHGRKQGTEIDNGAEEEHQNKGDSVQQKENGTNDSDNGTVVAGAANKKRAARPTVISRSEAVKLKQPLPDEDVIVIDEAKRIKSQDGTDNKIKSKQKKVKTTKAPAKVIADIKKLPEGPKQPVKEGSTNMEIDPSSATDSGQIVQKNVQAHTSDPTARTNAKKSKSATVATPMLTNKMTDVPSNSKDKAIKNNKGTSKGGLKNTQNVQAEVKQLHPSFHDKGEDVDDDDTEVNGYTAAGEMPHEWKYENNSTNYGGGLEYAGVSQTPSKYITGRILASEFGSEKEEIPMSSQVCADEYKEVGKKWFRDVDKDLKAFMDSQTKCMNQFLKEVNELMKEESRPEGMVLNMKRLDARVTAMKEITELKIRSNLKDLANGVSNALKEEFQKEETLEEVFSDGTGMKRRKSVHDGGTGEKKRRRYTTSYIKPKLYENERPNGIGVPKVMTKPTELKEFVGDENQYRQLLGREDIDFRDIAVLKLCDIDGGRGETFIYDMTPIGREALKSKLQEFTKRNWIECHDKTEARREPMYETSKQLKLWTLLPSNAS